MFTNEQIQELLDAAKPSVIESIKADLKHQISYETKAAAGQLIRQHVEAWIKENIIPEITRELIESKDSLISIGVTAGPLIVQAIATSITEAVSENLKDSWNRKKVFEALLG